MVVFTEAIIIYNFLSSFFVIGTHFVGCDEKVLPVCTITSHSTAAAASCMRASYSASSVLCECNVSNDPQSNSAGNIVGVLELGQSIYYLHFHSFLIILF